MRSPKTQSTENENPQGGTKYHPPSSGITHRHSRERGNLEPIEPFRRRNAPTVIPSAAEESKASIAPIAVGAV